MQTRAMVVVAALAAFGARAQPRAARAQQALARYEAGDFAACQALYEQLANEGDWLAPASELYNAACCAARGGKPDDAFRLLDGMLSKTGLRVPTDALTDTDFAGLHGDARWKRFIASVNALSKRRAIDREVQALVEADQTDRQGPWSAAITQRDAARRGAIEALHKRGRLKTARDFWSAALIFQHGDTVADIARAREFAKQADALGSNCDTRQMMAITEDRWLMYQQLPQRYGTQFQNSARDGGPPAWVLYQVDPTVSDAQRIAMCRPPLADLEPPP